MRKVFACLPRSRAKPLPARLAVLKNLAAVDEDVQKIIAREGGIDQILDAMRVLPVMRCDELYELISEVGKIGVP